MMAHVFEPLATHEGDLDDEVPGSRLQSGPALVVATIWTLNQGVDDLSLTLSLYTKLFN